MSSIPFSSYLIYYIISNPAQSQHKKKIKINENDVDLYGDICDINSMRKDNFKLTVDVSKNMGIIISVDSEKGESI